MISRDAFTRIRQPLGTHIPRTWHFHLVQCFWALRDAETTLGNSYLERAKCLGLWNYSFIYKLRVVGKGAAHFMRAPAESRGY